MGGILQVERFAPRSFFLIIALVYLALMTGCSQPVPKHVSIESLSGPDKQERIDRIKRSTVRIYVNGKPSGSGFIINANGLVATSFHVVGKTEPASRKRSFITYASPIEVQLHNGEKVPAIPHKAFIGDGIYEAVLKDYCVLEIRTPRQLVPLRLGNFSDAREGSTVYLCGYSLTREQPEISFGVVKTRWKDVVLAYQGSSSFRKRSIIDIAWLDIPMTKGNSGGPIVLPGKRPEDDRVIGIASFITTPLDQDLKALVKTLKDNAPSSRASPVCSIELFCAMKEAMGYDSLFIKGCISIDSLRNRLQKLAGSSL